MVQVRKISSIESSNTFMFIGEWFLDWLVSQCRSLNYFDKIELNIGENNTLYLHKDNDVVNFNVDIPAILSEQKVNEYKTINALDYSILEHNVDKLNSIREKETEENIKCEKIPFAVLKQEMYSSENKLPENKRHCGLDLTINASLSYQAGPKTWSEFVKIFHVDVRQEIIC